MKITSDQAYALAALLGVGAIVGAYFIFRTPPLKPIYENDETINAAQGVPFTVRFPRGDFAIATKDLTVTEQRDLGTETHVIMVAPVNPVGETYRIRSVAVEQDSGEPFPLEVVARPASAYGGVSQTPTRNPRRLPRGARV